MMEVKKEGIILEKTVLDFENEGVLNPGIIQVGDIIHMFYRAVSLGNYSSIGYCRLSGPLIIDKRDQKPVLFAEFDYELHGVEDPRIVKIDDLYYLSYTAYDGVNALGALATSTDLIHWNKQGIIVPQITYDEFSAFTASKGIINEKYSRYNNYQGFAEDAKERIFLWDKNLIFFPRRINGKLYFLHRVKPDIQIVVGITELSELTHTFWQNYFANINDFIVMSPKYPHEISYVGGGCPPIETAHGWLFIYHGVYDSAKGYVYTACAALLDLANPNKEIARLPYPLFKPDKNWELRGEVNNVCFPTGTALINDRLYIYYGAADERIAVASLNLTELLNELLLNTNHHE
ncbi:MAG: pesticidal protein Cry7Aa [Bacteroidia bacterium]|nr:pesticidal protein Cry7Aa [Bacteroidia bacterium]